MPWLKKQLYKAVCLFILSIFFVSCGVTNPLKKPAGNNNSQSSCQVEISRLESELVGIRQDQQNLYFQLEHKDTAIKTLKNTVAALENKISFIENTRPAPPIRYEVETQASNETPADIYKKARNLLIEDNFSQAAALLTDFINRYPRDTLADNAVYWLGECHYSQGNYKTAISVFQDLSTKYPKSEKVPDALLKTGYSYLSLDDFNRAHHYLKQVLKQYPFSPAAEKAQKKLGEFK